MPPRPPGQLCQWSREERSSTRIDRTWSYDGRSPARAGVVPASSSILTLSIMPDHPTNPWPIEHVIVLMLENRSFDHMLGYLDHPNAFEGLTDTEWNPRSKNDGTRVPVNDDAVPNIHPDPDHEHRAVLRQVFLEDLPFNPALQRKNRGFVWDYGLRIDKKKVQAQGLLRRVWGWIKRLFGGRAAPSFNQAEDVIRCFSYAPGKTHHVNVLSKLAKSFALCDHWHSSVPGETWPNRNFAHAATSNGQVNIKVGFYPNPTVYELLSDAHHSWTIYHDGPAQSWAFPALWTGRVGRGEFQPMSDFYRAVDENRLPSYSFIEPRHYALLKGYTNNQHPSENSRDPSNFYAGEKLICDIYSALIAKEEVWKKCLFVITYDEHGGLYDHVYPPIDPTRFTVNEQHPQFDFSMLGIRVPAVLVSPYISAGTVDSTQYDHTSIIRSLRELFGITAHLTNRDLHANPFLGNIDPAIAPRTGADIPDFDCQTPRPSVRPFTAGPNAPNPVELDPFQKSLVGLCQLMQEVMDMPGHEREALGKDLPTRVLDEENIRTFTSETELTNFLTGIERRFYQFTAERGVRR